MVFAWWSPDSLLRCRPGRSGRRRGPDGRGPGRGFMVVGVLFHCLAIYTGIMGGVIGLWELWLRNDSWGFQ